MNCCKFVRFISNRIGGGGRGLRNERRIYFNTFIRQCHPQFRNLIVVYFKHQQTVNLFIQQKQHNTLLPCVPAAPLNTLSSRWTDTLNTLFYFLLIFFTTKKEIVCISSSNVVRLVPGNGREPVHIERNEQPTKIDCK